MLLDGNTCVTVNLSDQPASGGGDIDLVELFAGVRVLVALIWLGCCLGIAGHKCILCIYIVWQATRLV